MEDNQEKMHSMISSQGYQGDLIKSLETTSNRYNFPAVRSVEDAMRNNSPTLVAAKHSAIAKNNGHNIVKDTLCLMFAKVVRVFNVARNADPTQIVEAVELIESEYFWLKLSDIYFICKQAKMGKYGKTYERIDVPTILGWVETHVNERLMIAEEKSLQEHDKYSGHEKDRKYDGYISKLHEEQTTDKQAQIKNLAYAMAKKMMAKDDDKIVQAALSTPNKTPPVKSGEKKK